MTETLGHLRGFGLPTLTQIVEMEQRTCTLEVASCDQKGRLYFSRGHLIDAEAGGRTGCAAAYEILDWNNVEIDIEDACPRLDVRINMSVAAILLELSAHNDEQNRDLVPQEEFMNRLYQILDKFKTDIPEFVSTDIVNIESGLSIGGGSIDPDFDASVASASFAEVVKSNTRALELLGLGDDTTEDILITTGRIYMLIRLLGQEYYQGLAITRRGNLGLARAIMKKHEPGLLQSLRELS